MPTKKATATTMPRSSARGAVAATTAAASWVALLASATLGIAGVHRLRAEVSVRQGKFAAEPKVEYRLIVQSYSRNSVVDGVPLAHARPMGSAQRSVTPEELTQGVAVDVVDVGEPVSDESVLVAWLERGTADLEFDGRRARPSRDAYLGTAPAELASAHIVLSRQLA
jgi:hypothetical protein